MKRIPLFLIMLCLLAACTARTRTCAAPAGGTQVVLASQSATLALATILVRGTDVRVTRAVPASYAPRGHAAYFGMHRAEFFELAQSADAVLCTNGVWPGDPLYAWARRANIRMVSIDATRPLDRTRAGVPHSVTPDGHIPPVWVAPGNFARMADITATDLMRLYPDCADRIGENLRSFKQELFRLRSEYEARLAAAQWFEVLALTRDFSPLLEEFGVQTVAVMDKPEHRWTDRDVRKLERTLADNHVHVVVCVWNPRVDIASAIERAGARVLVLDSFAVSGEPDARSVLRHYQTNLQRLLDALSGDPAGQ